MFIIAGTLHVDAGERGRYLDAVADVARLARQAPGCLDFVQSADPIDPERINVFERWESDEDLHGFRNSDSLQGRDMPPIKAAEVHKYRIAAVEEP